MTQQFERVYQTDPSRESHIERERGRIELSDQEYLDKVSPKTNSVKFTVTTLSNLPPPISMKLELPKPENTIRKIKQDAKNTSKSPKKKAAKDNRKAHKSAVARVQKEL